VRYRQCLLIKGIAQQMAWIPEKFAEVGKYVRLHDDDGWRIEQAYMSAPEEYVMAHRDDHRTAFPSLL
jgi:hypothetical protein